MGNLPSGYQVTFEDREAGTFTPVSQGDSIGNIQVAAQSKLTGRFFLHTSLNDATGTSPQAYSDGWKVYAAKGQIHISGNITGPATATLYDIMGREIRVDRLQRGMVNIIPSSELTNGIYLLSIRQAGKAFTTKIPVTN